MLVGYVVAIDMESFGKMNDEKHQGESIDFEVSLPLLIVLLLLSARRYLTVLNHV